MTLQDYFPLCATVRLFDADGRVCLRRAIGEDCALRNAGAPRDSGELTSHTLHFELARAKSLVPGVRRIDFAPARRLVEPLVAASAGRGGAPASAPVPLGPQAAHEYQRRRDVNVARLGRVDRLVAQSARVAEIYRQLGVDDARLSTLHLTLGHLEQIAPRAPRSVERLTLATLGGLVSPSKGSELVAETVPLLRRMAPPGSFRLVVFGRVHDSAAHLAESPDVELRGPYTRGDLDGALEDVDVGIMPSVWEEAYGFAGLEFLAKGIPVVANRIGGMVDYVRPDETGWLNDSCTPEGLAGILAGLVANRDEVGEMSRRVLAARASLIKPLEAHAGEIEEIYADAIRGASLPAP